MRAMHTQLENNRMRNIMLAGMMTIAALSAGVFGHGAQADGGVAGEWTKCVAWSGGASQGGLLHHWKAPPLHGAHPRRTSVLVDLIACNQVAVTQRSLDACR
jgi:hypothetical protein